MDHRSAILTAPAATWHVVKTGVSRDVFTDIAKSARRLVDEGLSSRERRFHEEDDR